MRDERSTLAIHGSDGDGLVHSELPARGDRRLFHVKPKNHQPENSAEIGVCVRTIVLECLSRLGFQPLAPEFADRVEQFATTLALWGARINLTSRPEDATEIAFHIVDSLMPLVCAMRPGGESLKNAFACNNRVMDLGSGAGLPGLVLGAASEAHFTLIEARRKRSSFLAVAAAAMRPGNVTIEVVHGTPSTFEQAFDTVTARAFGKPAEVYRIAAAALKTRGIVILYASRGQQLDPIAARAIGLGDFEQLEYEVARGNSRNERVLAIWHKLQECTN